jgi:hypothetical protein
MQHILDWCRQLFYSAFEIYSSVIHFAHDCRMQQIMPGDHRLRHRSLNTLHYVHSSLFMRVYYLSESDLHAPIDGVFVNAKVGYHHSRATSNSSIELSTWGNGGVTDKPRPLCKFHYRLHELTARLFTFQVRSFIAR